MPTATRVPQTTPAPKESNRGTKRSAAPKKPLDISSVSGSLILQAKLKVGSASDPLERDADAVADAFVRTGGTADITPIGAGESAIARRVAGTVVRRERPEAPSTGSFDAPHEVEAHIAQTAGRGSGLPADFQSKMESFANVDLSGVRLHTDDASSAAADAIGAEAFATGSDIYFGSGAGPADTHLLAHEVAHVTQQMTGSAGSEMVGRKASAKPKNPATAPDVAEPSSAAPDSAAPDSAAPETAPDSAAPDSAAPETAPAAERTSATPAKEAAAPETPAPATPEATAATPAVEAVEAESNIGEKIDSGLENSATAVDVADKAKTGVETVSTIVENGSKVLSAVDPNTGEGLAERGKALKGVFSPEETPKVLSGGEAVGGEALGLISGIIGLAQSIKGFYDMWKSGSAEDIMVAGHDGVKGAADVAKTAVSIAQAAGQGIGSALPGIDLALSLLSAARNVFHIFYLIRSNRQHKEAKVEALETGDSDLAMALGTALTKSDRKLGLTAVQLAGDITIAVGSIAQLAAGPFGTTVKMAGAIAKGIGALAGKIMEHYEQEATMEATFKYDVAQKIGTDEEKKAAKTERLSVDAVFAIQEILDKSIGEGGKRTPKLLALLATYGLGDKWVAAYDSAANKEVKMVEGASIVQRFLGAKMPGSNVSISDTISRGLQGAWQWIKSKTSKGSDEKPTASPGDIWGVARAKAAAVLAEKLPPRQKKTEVMDPAKVTSDLSGTYNTMQVLYISCLSGDGKSDLKVKQESIDEGFASAIFEVSEIYGILPKSIAVIGGRVSFETPQSLKKKEDKAKADQAAKDKKDAAAQAKADKVAKEQAAKQAKLKPAGALPPAQPAGAGAVAELVGASA